jgi:hypothetical protein
MIFSAEEMVSGGVIADFQALPDTSGSCLTASSPRWKGQPGPPLASAHRVLPNDVCAAQFSMLPAGIRSKRNSSM